MDAINILYSRIFFWLGLHLLHQDGVPEKSQHLYRTTFKVKSTIHNWPVVLPPTGLWLLVVVNLRITVREPNDSVRIIPPHHSIALASIIGATTKRSIKALPFMVARCTVVYPTIHWRMTPFACKCWDPWMLMRLRFTITIPVFTRIKCGHF